MLEQRRKFFLELDGFIKKIRNTIIFLTRNINYLIYHHAILDRCQSTINNGFKIQSKSIFILQNPLHVLINQFHQDLFVCLMFAVNSLDLNDDVKMLSIINNC